MRDSLSSQILGRLRSGLHSWVWIDVLIPLLLTRFALILAGWFSTGLLPNPEYPTKEAVARGWNFSSHRWLDIWGRWDTGWYFSIVQNGYSVSNDIYHVQSNIAFFPFYPYLIKLLLLPFPAQMLTPGRLLLAGVLLSNAFLLGALILLHKLVTSLADRDVARRTILYLLLFPTGFFLSCFYTESTFLFLSVGAFYAAHRRAWMTACLFGCCLALTRPLGVLISVPLFWMYLAGAEWKLNRIKANVLWFLLIPAGLLSFFFYAYRLTGDFLAPMHAQKAWQKVFAMPWNTILDPVGGTPHMMRVDQAFTILFLAGAVLSLRKLPSASYGIYALLLILPPLTSGTLISTTRYYVVVFPVFIVFALLGRRSDLADQSIRVVFLSLQIMLMIAWCQFYWMV